MNMHKLLAGLIAVVVFFAVVFLTIRFSTPEDGWLCQNGTWVKHGNPSDSMPTTDCGDAQKPVEENNTGMANPASVNCTEKGGEVVIKTDATGGQYGVCVFPDGKSCEEWAMFRGECPVGGELPKETSLVKPTKDELIAIGPITVEGTMPGSWFFEANAIAEIRDAEGKILGSGPLTAQGEWMTTATVPFSGKISFSAPSSETGTLVLRNDNPSGLPENDKSESYPIKFGTIVKVFFPNEQKTPGMPDCSKVFAVERTVLRTTAVARAALDEMLKGPTEGEKGEGFSSMINPGVTIQNLSIENGVAKVDFSKTIEEAVGGSCRVGAIRSQIEATLKQFPTVSSVIISVDGRTEDILQP